MARPDKAAAVAELQDKFTNSAGAVLTDYRGLTVKALKDLRRSLGEDATYAVSKNTLTTIAARQAGIAGLDEHLVGPTAIAFIDGDPVTVAKGLRDFSRGNPLLVIKGGILDGKVLSPDDIRRLADLESREVLLAKVAGGLQGVLQQAVSLFAAPLSKAARTLAALETAAVDNPALLAQGVADDSAAAESVAVVADTTEADPAADTTEAAPAADNTEAAPAADITAAAAAAEEPTTAAVAAEDN
ncbi:MAG TPA: 50S ribosomal protein L10 [Propionibacteriaceae bacterium]|nr:50S ribosomal protein L10 [Propionibacteriaceae bacterium]